MHPSELLAIISATGTGLGGNRAHMRGFPGGGGAVGPGSFGGGIRVSRGGGRIQPSSGQFSVVPSRPGPPGGGQTVPGPPPVAKPPGGGRTVSGPPPRTSGRGRIKLNNMQPLLPPPRSGFSRINTGERGRMSDRIKPSPISKIAGHPATKYTVVGGGGVAATTAGLFGLERAFPLPEPDVPVAYTLKKRPIYMGADGKPYFKVPHQTPPEHIID